MKVALSFLVLFIATLVAADDEDSKCKSKPWKEDDIKYCCTKYKKWCPYTHGDPHFATWDGGKFDFHGECDLVFVQDPGFRNGLGLDIHVRTKIVRNWSYIDVAVVKIGKDVLEFKGGDDEHYWINKVSYDGTPANKIGDFNVDYKRTSSKQREMTLDLGEGLTINIKSYKTMVGVTIVGGSKVDFEKSVGLTGEFGTGRKIGRDGRVITDPNEFGQEWQVRAEDGLFFRTLEGPQFPLEQCKMPSSFQGAERHRRLGESTARLQAAEKACAHKISDPEEFDNCVFDVLLTEDLGIAGAF
jgi:von Willebrand factor type D domain